MKSKDQQMLEEAYNKTRLLKEQGDQPMSVEDFEKEERLKGHMQRAEQRAEDEIAPELGPVSDEDIIWIADLESQVGRLRQEILNGRDVVLKHLEEGPAFILS
jgi:hypothetical protein